MNSGTGFALKAMALRSSSSAAHAASCEMELQSAARSGEAVMLQSKLTSFSCLKRFNASSLRCWYSRLALSNSARSIILARLVRPGVLPQSGLVTLGGVRLTLTSAALCAFSKFGILTIAEGLRVMPCTVGATILFAFGLLDPIVGKSSNAIRGRVLAQRSCLFGAEVRVLMRRSAGLACVTRLTGDSLVSDRFDRAKTGVRGQVVLKRLDCVKEGAITLARLRV